MTTNLALSALTSTGSLTKRVLGDRFAEIVNVMDYGALGDGTGALLSTRFGSLGAAQAVYPFVTALTQTIDYAALQAAIYAAFPGGLGTPVSNKAAAAALFIPPGNFMVNQVLYILSVGGGHVYGCGKGVSVITYTGLGSVGTNVNGGFETITSVFMCIGTSQVKFENFSIQGVAGGAGSAQFTATCSTNQINVTSFAFGSGTLKVGQQIFGVGIPHNTLIASFGSGGGATGTYNLTTTPGTLGSTTMSVPGGNQRAAQFTSTCATNVLTVTSFDFGDGTLAAGQQIYGPGIPAYTQIDHQLTGSAGSTGTYQLTTTPGTLVSATRIVTAAGVSFTASCATNQLNVSAIAFGILAVNQVIVGLGIPTGTIIASLGSGSGGTGTYNLSTTPGTLGSRVMYVPSTSTGMFLYQGGTPNYGTTTQCTFENIGIYSFASNGLIFSIGANGEDMLLINTDVDSCDFAGVRALFQNSLNHLVIGGTISNCAITSSYTSANPFTYTGAGLSSVGGGFTFTAGVHFVNNTVDHYESSGQVTTLVACSTDGGPQLVTSIVNTAAMSVIGFTYNGASTAGFIDTFGPLSVSSCFYNPPTNAGAGSIVYASNGIVNFDNNVVSATGFAAGSTLSTAGIGTFSLRNNDFNSPAGLPFPNLGSTCVFSEIECAPLTVANLPTASTKYRGVRLTVTDYNRAVVFGDSAIGHGGAATVVPVFCSGSDWLVGG